MHSFLFEVLFKGIRFLTGFDIPFTGCRAIVKVAVATSLCKAQNFWLPEERAFLLFSHSFLLFWTKEYPFRRPSVSQK
jgi:hypothetical protein